MNANRRILDCATFGRVGPAVFGLALMLSSSGVSAQCVMCREALKSGGSQELITGFMFSTLLLTTVPLLIASGFAFAFYRAFQRRKAEEHSTTVESESPLPPIMP